MPRNSLGLVLITILTVFVSHASAQENGILIETRVDGPSELRITKQGIYWANGMNAKPGRHEGRNEPTYVNNVPWMPIWQHPGNERGVDKSALYPLAVSSLDLQVELLAVGETRNADDIEVRSPIMLSPDADELAVIIPDPEPGSRWYKLRLVPQK